MIPITHPLGHSRQAATPVEVRGMAFFAGDFEPAGPSILIPLPWSNSPLALNDRQQHFVKAKKVKAALAEAREAIAAMDVPRQSRVILVLHLQLKDRRRRDCDNLAMTLKCVQDALVQEGVIEDDDWTRVAFAGQMIHAPEKGVAATMWIEIIPLEPPPPAPDLSSPAGVEAFLAD